MEKGFQGAVNLTTITIPSSVKKIGAYAFDGCTSLSKAYIENAEEFMADGFFEYTYREGYLSSGKTMTAE